MCSVNGCGAPAPREGSEAARLIAIFPPFVARSCAAGKLQRVIESAKLV